MNGTSSGIAEAAKSRPQSQGAGGQPRGGSNSLPESGEPAGYSCEGLHDPLRSFGSSSAVGSRPCTEGS
eukprot:3627460-Pyramimonas_sp.AAC.1